MPSIQDYMQQFAAQNAKYGYGDSGDLNTQPIPYRPLDNPAPAKRSSALSAIPDAAVALAKGAVDLGQGVVGVADLLTGGYAGKGMQALGYNPDATNQYLSTFQSAEANKQAAELANTKGFLPSAGYVLSHPRTLANMIAENLPSMYGGGALVRGALEKATPKVAEKLGPAFIGNIGEGVTQAGQMAEQVRAGNESGTLTPGQIAASVASGAIDTLIGRKSGRLAERLGIPDVETSVGGGSFTHAAADAAKQPGFLKRVGVTALNEGLIQELPQSAQEQMWQNLATGKPLGDGVAEAAAQGMALGAAMGGGFAAIQRPSAVSNDALKGAIDQHLADQTQAPAQPEQPGDPLQAEWEAMQQQHAAANAIAADRRNAEGSVTTPFADQAQRNQAVIDQITRQAGLDDARQQAEASVTTPFADQARQNDDTIHATMAQDARDAVSAMPTHELVRSLNLVEQSIAAGQPVEHATGLMGMLRDELEARDKAAPTQASQPGEGTQQLFDDQWQRSPEVAQAAANAPAPDMTADELAAHLQAAATPRIGGQAALMAGQTPTASPIALAQGGTPVTLPATTLKGLPQAAKAELSKHLSNPEHLAAAVADMFYTKAGAGSSASYVLDKLPALYQQLTGQALPETPQIAPAIAPSVIGAQGEDFLQGETPEQAAANYARRQELAALETPLPSTEVPAGQASFLTPIKGQVKTTQPPLSRVETAKQKAARAFAEQQKASRLKAAEVLGTNIEPAQQVQAAQETNNGAAPTQVVERGGQGQRGALGTGDGNSGVEPISSARGSRGRATTPAASSDRSVAVGSTASEPASRVAPEGKAPTVTRGYAFKDLRDAYLNSKSGEAGRESRMTELTGLAEIEQIGGTKQQRDQAKRFLDSDQVDPKEAATARRQAQDSIGRVAAQEKRQGERDKAAAARQRALDKQMKEHADAHLDDLVSEVEKAHSQQTPEQRAAQQQPRGRVTQEMIDLWNKFVGVDASKPLFSVGTAPKSQGLSKESVTSMLKAVFASPSALGKRVVVVNSEQELPVKLLRALNSVSDGSMVGGFFNAELGKVFLIANNLSSEREAMAVAMHELGVHMGMRDLIGPQNYSKLIAQLDAWEKSGEGLEGQLAKRAAERAVKAEVAAGQKPNAWRFNEERLAYFVEEAVKLGIDPTALATQPKNLKQWFSRLWTSMQTALRKLGVLPASLKAADIVDLAYGAAYLQLQDTDAVETTAPSSQMFSIKDSAASDIGSPETRQTLGNFGEVTNTAKDILGQFEKLKPKDWAGMKLTLFKQGIGWMTKHHLSTLFNKALGGSLALNVKADTIQEATAARTSQLFNAPYHAFEALPAERQAKVARMMEATEFKIDLRKSWEEQTHLHSLTGKDLAQAKKYVNEYKQGWGQLTEAERKIYNDLAAMNETLYTMEMAVSTYNMVHANPGDARKLDAFKADPTEQFRQQAAVHDSIETAHDYWKKVLAGYTQALDKHVAEQRGLLPSKNEADPAHQEAVRKALKDVKNEKVRKQIRAALRTHSTAQLNDEQKKIVRHLTPLEAQLRMVGETTESFKHAPYFHLGRFGDEFVSFRVRMGADEQADPAAMLHVQKVLADKFPDVSIRADATDPHVFARFESIGQATAFENTLQELQQQGWLMQPGTKDKNNEDLGEIKRGSKKEIIAGYHTAGPNWLSRVVESIQAEGFDEDVTQQMVAHVRSLYLDSLPDTSAIKVKQKREGRPGWYKDMIRNYAHRMRVGSNRVASLAAEPTRTQSFAEMNDAIAKARSDIKNVPKPMLAKLEAVVNEFERRNAEQMSIPHTPGVDMLRAVNHAYFLGMSPSYVLIQMTQLGTLTWPELSKKHGYVKSAKAIAQVTNTAFKVLSTVMREGYKTRGVKGAADMVITGDMLEKAGVSKSDAEFLIKIMASGKLDIGNSSRELGRVAEGETEGKWGRHGAEALRVASAFGYASETVTRMITALAVKRLYNEADVVEHAIHVIDESMLNYTTQNTGRMTGKQGFVGKWTPVMFSFMQYQFQLLEKLYREFYNGFASGASEQEKKEARRFLAAHMMSMMTLAGSLGLPFATAVAAAADKLCGLFGDGHCDSKTALRNMTADVFGHDIEPLISRGLVRGAGFDISDRAGEADILPFSKFLADKRAMDDSLKDLAWSSWGAPSSMLANMFDGYEKIAQGDLLGGMQQGVPLALRGPVKAFAMTEDGYTDKNGNKLPMTPGAYDILLQAIGLNPGDKADYQQAKFAQTQRAGVLSRESNLIRNSLATAIERGDTAAQEKWMARAQEFDATNPSRAILPRMGTTLTRRARMQINADATGTPLGVPTKDYKALDFTSFYRPN